MRWANGIGHSFIRLNKGSGIKRITPMITAQMGRTWTMLRCLSTARRIARATSSGCAIKRAGSAIPSVMRVATYPGSTVTTCTPLPASRLRNPDRKAVNPALAAALGSFSCWPFAIHQQPEEMPAPKRRSPVLEGGGGEFATNALAGHLPALLRRIRLIWYCICFRLNLSHSQQSHGAYNDFGQHRQAGNESGMAVCFQHIEPVDGHGHPVAQMQVGHVRRKTFGARARPASADTPPRHKHGQRPRAISELAPRDKNATRWSYLHPRSDCADWKCAP